MKISVNYYYNVNVFKVYYLIISFVNLINNLFIKCSAGYLFIK